MAWVPKMAVIGQNISEKISLVKISPKKIPLRKNNSGQNISVKFSPKKNCCTVLNYLCPGRLIKKERKGTKTTTTITSIVEKFDITKPKVQYLRCVVHNLKLQTFFIFKLAFKPFFLFKKK
jgi:hypothetical protein